MRWDDIGHFICELQLPLFNVWILELEFFLFIFPVWEWKPSLSLCAAGSTNDVDEHRILNRTYTRNYIMITVFLNHTGSSVALGMSMSTILFHAKNA